MKNSNIISFQLFIPAILIFIAAFLLAFPAETSAATYRNRTAQTPPGNPLSTQTVRVWMESDTAFGETAGIEYLINGVYTKVLGTFDNTNGPAPANWYADIPMQPGGTMVSYQLFTRNEFGNDYGFTGFNWSYTVQVATAAAVTIAGRVVNAGGKGIGKAAVLLINGDGLTRTVLTNSFGFYKFTEVQSGAFYLLSAKSKDYQFAVPTQAFAVNSELTDIDFTALPR